MKNKFKYISVFFISIILAVVSIILFKTDKEQKIRGSIEILANENSYEYLKECANEFMQFNNKADIKIIMDNDYNYMEKQVEKNKTTNIVEIDRVELSKLSLKNINLDNDMKNIVDTYSKNFSEARIGEVTIDDNIIGIPLNSRPLVLYLREDMLNEYGYNSHDVSTWNDIISIGSDIYNRSNGKVRILNANGKDYEDLISLLIMQYLSEDKTPEDIKTEVENKIQQLKENNILNLNEGEDFLARISSINGMKELMGLNEKCEWVAINPPSKEIGTNRFFCAEGSNLLILNEEAENKKLIEKFVTFIITNNKDTIKYIKEGQFFSSYLYTYRNKEIEDKVKNFNEKSPLVVMNNIGERAPIIKDYDKYIKIKNQIVN